MRKENTIINFMMLEENRMKTCGVKVEISMKSMGTFETYLYEKEKAEATIQKYIRDVRTFFDYLEGNFIIDKPRLLDYKSWLLSRYAVSSVNSMLAALNQFLEFLELDSWKIKRVKMQQNLFLREEKELTKEEYRVLVEEARRNGKKQLALCMETIAATGVRISELRFFTVENVRQGRIEIFNKGKYRRIFLPKSIRQKLLVFSAKEGIMAGSIFITRNGNPKNRSNLWSEMKALEKRSGIDGRKIFPHNLRHLFARRYYQETKDIAGLADLLGHANLNVTRIYTSNSGEVYQKQLDEMSIL